jgi:hypothetical protein
MTNFRNRIISEYYEQLYALKLDSLVEMDKLLETQSCHNSILKK